MDNYHFRSDLIGFQDLQNSEKVEEFSVTRSDKFEKQIYWFNEFNVMIPRISLAIIIKPQLGIR